MLPLVPTRRATVPPELVISAPHSDVGDGSGGDSIYGKPFNDEKGGLKLKHEAAGIVSMANSGWVDVHAAGRCCGFLAAAQCAPAGDSPGENPGACPACRKNSNTSQFFITLGPAPACDGKHTVFGRVVEGLSILERIGEGMRSAPDGSPRVLDAASAGWATSDGCRGGSLDRQRRGERIWTLYMHATPRLLPLPDALAASEGGEPLVDVCIADSGCDG